MKFLLLLVAFTTWASANFVPTDNDIFFEFEKLAQTPEEFEGQLNFIKMVMPELNKLLPEVMQRPQPMQQRPVEYYYMEPNTKLMPPLPMQKKPKKHIMMESLPMVLQMIAEEHSTPQNNMPMHPLPPPPMKHTPQPPKPFLEPPHFYMKHYEEPAPLLQMQQLQMQQHPMQQHPMQQFQMQQHPMHQQMVMSHPMMHNMVPVQQQISPYSYQYLDNQFPTPPPTFRYHPMYEFHPPMMHQQSPNFWYNHMNQPMMGQELYYW